MEKTGLKGYIYEFSVDYDAISNSDTSISTFTNIHKYLMEKNKIK